jgi:hypothetical protein
VLQLQQKTRSLEKQLRELTAAALSKQQASAEGRSRAAGRSGSGFPSRRPAAASTPQQRQLKGGKGSAADAVGSGSPDDVVSDATHSPDGGASPAAGCLEQWPLKQQQQQWPAGRAAGVGAGAGGASSWPGLCAELEGEVEQLRAQLAAQQQEVGVSWIAWLLQLVTGP